MNKQIALPLQLPEYVKMTMNSLTIGDVPIDKWAVVGECFGKLESFESWSIGDWFAQGEQKYGLDKVQEIIESPDWSGPSFLTCQRFGQVARRYKPEERRESLPFRHHRLAGMLPTEIRKDLLDKAEKENLSSRAFEAEVQKVRGNGSGANGSAGTSDAAPGTNGKAAPVTVDHESGKPVEEAPTPGAPDEVTIGAMAQLLVDKMELANRQASDKDVRAHILGDPKLVRRVRRLIPLLTLIESKPETEPKKKPVSKVKTRTVKAKAKPAAKPAAKANGKKEEASQSTN